jgi:hypothetical protein
MLTGRIVAITNISASARIEISSGEMSSTSDAVTPTGPALTARHDATCRPKTRGR